MKLSLQERIDPSNRESVEAWAEAFDVFPSQILTAIRFVSTRAQSVQNYLHAMGQIGTRSSSPIYDAA
jgi:hypothetical protein